MTPLVILVPWNMTRRCHQNIFDMTDLLFQQQHIFPIHPPFLLLQYQIVLKQKGLLHDCCCYFSSSNSYQNDTINSSIQINL